MYCSLENVGNDFSEPLKINNSWGLGTCIPLTLLKFAIFHVQNLHSNEYCVILPTKLSGPGSGPGQGLCIAHVLEQDTFTLPVPNIHVSLTHSYLLLL